MLGIKYQIQEVASLKTKQLQEESELLRNWEEYFSELIVQEFGVRRQAILQVAYLDILMAYKDSVFYRDGNFELISDISSLDGSNLVNGETRLETILEQEVKEEICQCLTQFLGGEWNGEETVVGIFLNGLKTDLRSS